jgi:hypothetical protein
MTVAPRASAIEANNQPRRGEMEKISAPQNGIMPQGNEVVVRLGKHLNTIIYADDS